MELTEDQNENADAATETKAKNPRNRFRLDPKEEREKRNRRRARVIVRNISYKATDESLREHFSSYGKIVELNLLKRADGKLVGCAFIQFEKVNEAAKAILKATSKEFLGRPVYVDWAVGKDEYTKRQNAKVKDEDEGEMRTETSADVADVDIKEETEEDTEMKSEEDAEVKSEEDSEQSGGDSDDGSAEEEEENDAMSGSDENSDDIKIEDSKKTKRKKSDDVKEGCTIFIKNVPFDATSDDLSKCCRKFGPLFYALINTEPVSGHSKGTAFVKFKSKDSADMCLSAGEEFVLFGSVMEPLPALSREEVRNQKENMQKKPSDSRNLYLVKEGLIMAGSKAAEGVSTSDMNKRHKLEQTKSQILKNLNRFVSRNRLSIHNLPFHYDDEKLRNMVKRCTGLRARECRVMRENKPSAGFPLGKPKGFGFVSFNTHQDALTALRKLNNNPSVFSSSARPIVGFSIEDRSVQKIKERRIQKSREQNPTYQQKLEKLKAKRAKKRAERKENKSSVQTEIKKATAPKNQAANADADLESFVGTASKPGAGLKMRSNKKIKEQAQEHLKKVSDLKRKEKKRKEKRLHRIEKKQIDRPKKGKKKLDKDGLSDLVNKYKQILDKRNEAGTAKKVGKRSKWYVE